MFHITLIDDIQLGIIIQIYLYETDASNSPIKKFIDKLSKDNSKSLHLLFCNFLYQVNFFFGL